VRIEGNQAKHQIENGSLIIFKGPLKDRNGKLCLKANQTTGFDWLANMNFLVSGIEGPLPNK
jgi:hypothetical protein